MLGLNCLLQLLTRLTRVDALYELGPHSCMADSSVCACPFVDKFSEHEVALTRLML